MLADNDGPTGSFDWAGSARQRHSQYAPILVDETGAHAVEVLRRTVAPEAAPRLSALPIPPTRRRGRNGKLQRVKVLWENGVYVGPVSRIRAIVERQS